MLHLPFSDLPFKKCPKKSLDFKGLLCHMDPHCMAYFWGRMFCKYSGVGVVRKVANPSVALKRRLVLQLRYDNPPPLVQGKGCDRAIFWRVWRNRVRYMKKIMQLLDASIGCSAVGVPKLRERQKTRKSRDQSRTICPSLIAPKHSKASVWEPSCPGTSREQSPIFDDFLNPRLPGLLCRFPKKRPGPRNLPPPAFITPNLTCMNAVPEAAACQQALIAVCCPTFE